MMESFKSSGVHTKQAHVDIPEGLFEEEHGRKGFFGRVSQLYHSHPPVNWSNIEGELRPRQLKTLHEAKLNQQAFTLVLFNNDVQISYGYYPESDPENEFFRNADFDELLFAHQGQGHVHSIYGTVPFKTGDYINIPRGSTYRIEIDKNSPTHFLKIESASEFEQPERGLLGPNALYDQTAIFTPEAKDWSSLSLNSESLEYIVHIKRLGEITKITYPFHPLCVQGWKGSVYPFRLSIYDICPVMSHRYHIPPSGHTTFVCRNFVVCSFVARPLEDSSHKVLKVPFYHSNIDFDEVLFYHQGDFFSRDGIAPGALTFHPQGVHHGPHPNAYSKSVDKLHTNEFAVMIDTRNPLKMTTWFKENENKNYWKSWMKKD